MSSEDHLGSSSLFSWSDVDPETSSAPPPSVAATGTPGAQADVGERLFVETRFAQFFKAHLPPGGNVNDPLPAGDPVVAKVLLPGGTPPGVASPFAGMSMNCRSCHFVDEFVGVPGGGMRTYTDFAIRSPIPSRPDGKLTAPRNSPPLVNASLNRPGGTLFHFDGEFSTLEDLIVGTFTGRNFGWLPGQKAEAIRHIARVMREDDGTGAIAQQFDGLSYSTLFTGANPNIPDELRLPPEFRVLIQSASDQEIFDAVVKVVAAYVNGLRFSQSDDAGNLIRSPFDVFLSRNGLPQQPNSGETPLDYSRRLLTLVNGLASPQFVTANPNDRSLAWKVPVPRHSALRVRSSGTGRSQDISYGTGHPANRLTGRRARWQSRQLPRLPRSTKFHGLQVAQYRNCTK